MEKLGFNDLVVLAESLSVDYDKLLYQDSNGRLVNSVGLTCERSDIETSLATVSAESLSDVAYDKLCTLIKVLKGIYEYRPLPF